MHEYVPACMCGAWKSPCAVVARSRSTHIEETHTEHHRSGQHRVYTNNWGGVTVSRVNSEEKIYGKKQLKHVSYEDE